MPQGRRKVPFSAKQKKLQLQQKREKKAFDDTTVVSSFTAGKQSTNIEVINEQPSSSSYNPNRYRLVFKKDKEEDVQKRKELAKKPFIPVSKEELEVSYEEVFVPGSELDMPKRPLWDYSFGKDKLEAQEQKYFREYIDNLERRFGESELSHFEMNLETWRQLWRVLEFSDIVLLVADVRYSVYHFSPVLHDYVIKELKKDIILVLNKVDLVPAPLVLAWKNYFKKNFPNLHILCFASYAGMLLKDGKKGRRIGKLYMAIEGARQLLKTCEDIVKDQVDLSSWKKRIDAQAADLGSGGDNFKDSDSDEDGSSDEEKISKKDNTQKAKNDTSYYKEQRFKNNTLTIGFIGHPNVGKSSFLNAVFGRKVASVSRTPGHTKHYQTIMLTPNVTLCDCPGLVFPSLVAKPVQVLMGCYPIAQLREPYSAVEFLSQRVPVQSILKLKHPALDCFEKGEEITWSSYDICEAWAIKRGFRTAKAGRPDVYRAANNILRMALDGRTICLAFLPPNFTKEEEMWSTHTELAEIIAIQAHREKFDKYADHAKCGGSYQEQYREFCDEDDDKSDASDELSSEDDDNAESSKAAPDNKFGSLGDDVNC